LSVTLPAGRHTVTVRRQAPAAVGTPEYAVCADPDDHPDPFPAADRWPRQPDGTVLLTSPDRIVCAQGEPVRTIPGATYRFSAEYRSSYGQTPQVCVWFQPAYRCADTPAPVRSTAWQTVTALVRPPTGVTSVTPRVIAAASAVVRTSITYRNVSLTRVALATVQATPTGPQASAAPRVDATVVSASRYRAAVHAATGRFTLVLPESYAPGWALDGLPRGWTARHVVVDGYANGWLVTGTGNADLSLVYRPSRWSEAALVISALAAAAAVILVAGRRLRRAARKRRPLGPAVESK
jgi:arabinofuranan 3-O-arabinosyltransferase